MDSILEAQRRRMRGGLTFLVLIGICLLATHRGEFWPYSTYPMFSHAGKRWQRVVVREDDGIPSARLWERCTLDTLPGKPFAMEQWGMYPQELAGYLEHTQSWDDARRTGLHKQFERALQDRKLVLYRVTPGPNVRSAVATPLLTLDAAGVTLTPSASMLAGDP